jgi:hypothetical protein
MMAKPKRHFWRGPIYDQQHATGIIDKTCAFFLVPALYAIVDALFNGLFGEWDPYLLVFGAAVALPAILTVGLRSRIAALVLLAMAGALAGVTAWFVAYSTAEGPLWLTLTAGAFVIVCIAEMTACWRMFKALGLWNELPKRLEPRRVF